jgi:hypothetical protein
MSADHDVPSTEPDEGDAAYEDAGGREQKGPGKVEDPSFAPLNITTHRELLTYQGEIFARLNQDPKAAGMLLINPVLAFRDVGVEMTREIAHHVLHTIQHTPRLRKRRDALEAELSEALGEPPQADNPAWVSRFLFETLQLEPLETEGLEPTYKAPLNEAAVKRLQEVRPQRQRKEKLSPRSSFLRVRLTRPAVRRLDVDAPLPELRPAKEAPQEVDLETLYFYKESHPLARALLELGIIQRRSFPIHSADSYRRIKRGEKPNAFRSWIDAVRFPEDTDDESNG